MNRPAASRALAGLVALSGCAVETTYQDVAPILEARCNSCHVDGVSTYRPYFTDYESVASLERILRDTVTSREMPPFGMDNTMRCGNNYFADDGLWLTDLELQTLTDWVDDGVPRGGPDEPTDLAAAPVAVEPALERVDRTLEMAEEYAFSGFDPGSQHRCFITDPGMVEPATLSAFEVEPGNRFTVQSVALYALDDEASQTAAEALDAADVEPGYPCFGGPGVEQARFVGTWVWGRSVVRLPPSTGIPLRPAGKLLLQIHYNPQGGSLHPAGDRTRVHLELGDGAAEAEYLELSAQGFSLRPGIKDAVARGTIDVDRPMRILGVAPLMHESGATLTVSRVRPFSETCLAEVHDWAFYNHLRLYQYLTTPPEVLPGDRLAIECRFETLNRIEPTRQGWDEASEQCLARLYTVPSGDAP
jgi:hypothetical protein